ncbi:MAG: glycosyltransferase family 4 protein [Myxococcota bacterium]
MASRILLISRVLSPFQLELVQALRDRGVEAHVLFSNGGTGTRPKHWDIQVPEWAILRDVESNPLEIRGILDELRPDAVVYGGYRGLPVPLTIRHCKRRGIGLAFWLEPPFPTLGWRNMLREVLMSRVLREADYLFCIGPSSMEFFQRLIPDEGRLHCLPYGQDLSDNFGFERDRGGDTVTFLFSGKYQHRNNIWEMLSAWRDLRVRHGERVRFLLSGYSGMEPAVREEVRRDPVLREATTHDVDFDTWSERLRPFKTADVLMIPGIHAGWGLIVPEAMSLGMPVIGSAGIGAVRFMVRDGDNGFVIQPTYWHMVRAMERFLEEPSLIERMGEVARRDARVADAPTVAGRMLDLLAPHLG